MRLIAWNANYNGHRKRSLEEAVGYFQDLEADVIVLSEIARPAKANPFNADWVGHNQPGLAVIAKKGWEIKTHVASEGAASLMRGFAISGKVDFHLLAIWPIKHRDQKLSYHHTLMQAIERYESFLKSPVSILAGDLNSNTRVRGQKNTHPKFVAAMKQIGMVSAYHEIAGEEHGQETIATYRHRYSDSDVFHIDYCFLNQTLAQAAKLEVLRGDDWSARSDHFPIVLDLDNAAIKRASQSQN